MVRLLRGLAFTLVSFAFVTLGGGVACSSTASPAREVYMFQTTPKTVAPGEETYWCYAETLTQDLAIDQISFKKTAGVHHLLLSKATVKEPEGWAECKVLLRTSWIPMFGAATDDATLTTPAGSGFVLPAGTQIVAQFHFLNPTAQAVTLPPRFEMRRTQRADVDPVGLLAFGPSDFSLPAKSKTDLVDECTTVSDYDVFALGPHMHYAGRGLTFEVQQPDGTYKKVYSVDDYAFDRQKIDQMTLPLASNLRTRTTCTFENKGDQPLVFGESSSNEMCFLVMFVRGREGLSTCTKKRPPAPPNPLCLTKPANDLGVGKKCTKSGRECGADLSCTLDQAATPDGSPGFCFKVGCTATADCGGGDAVCCAPKEAGGIVKTCIPETCRPSDCTL